GCPASAGRARSPSSEHHVGPLEVRLERDAGQALERLDVTGARALDNRVRKLGAGIGLVPSQRFAVVAHELLIERLLRPAGSVLVGRPEPGRVGRERLVGEYEAAVLVEPELELRVGEDDPEPSGAFGDVAVEAEREPLDLVVALLADELDAARPIDVLVVAGLGLGRRSEDRLG